MTGTPFSPDPTRTAGAATDDSAGPSLEARLADRTRELDEVTRQHAATVEILDIIARSPGGLQTTLDAVVRAAVRHCGADDATMFLREGTEIFGAAHEGPLPSGFGARQQIQRSHLQTRVIRDGQIIHAPDTEALDPVEFASVIAVARQRGVRALVAAPIRHAGEVIGSLLLRRREAGPFSARQIAMLETVAAQAGIAVANAGVITELRESLEQQTATAEVLQVINASPSDTAPVFETILQKTHALCGIAYGSLQLYDGQKFRAVATHGLPEPLATRLREGYVPGPNLRQLIDGAAFSQFPDIGLVDEPMARAAAEGGMKTLLCVALRTDGRLLGQIVCVRMEVRPFTDREIALLQGFAAQAVIAMENARLITETREALEQQTATADILRVISQSPTDIGPVLRAVVSAALRFCGAEDAIVALRDGDESVTAAHEGPLGVVVGTRARLDPRGRGTVRAIVERRTIHVPDVAAPDQNEFAVWRDLAREQNFRAFVVAPMMRDGVAIGSIGLRRPNPGPFTPRQIALLESFAAQAVIAIENVRLFTELRAALDRQTAMAEVLAVINANPGELTPVFDAILEKALSLSRSSYGILARFDGEKAWQVAGRNIPPALADLARGGHKPESGTMMHRLVLGDDVAHLADIRDDEAYRAGVPSRVLTADVAGARSQLLVALRKDGRLLGCINIYRTEVRAFSEAEVTLVRSFADQAVIAMENARLITETREALERQTAMAEVLAAINANPGELTPVFDTILDRALSLSGSSIGMLVRFDGEKGWLVAGRNVPPAVGDVALGGFIPAAGTLFHRMVQGDDVAFLADIRDDEAYRAGVPQRVILADEGGARSLLTVALRKDGRLLGGIQVYRTEVRAFSEAEVTLVRSFADQAVIAMENARLLTETREALEQQQASADVLSVISSSVADTAPVFERILDSCERLFGTNQVAICMVHDDGQVHARAVRGAVITKMMSVLPQPVAQTATGRAFRQASAVHIADAASEPDLPQSIRDAVARLGNYSCVFAPMLWERQGIGSICVTRQPPLPFTAKEIALLATFADQAVIAIQNARLFNETREALERQTAMAEVLAAINANPGELKPVFDTILDKALSLSRSSFGFLLRFEGEKFWMVAERDVPPGIKAFTLLGHVPEAGTLLHRMVLGDDVAYLADITDDEAYRAGAPSRVAMADEGGARSLLVVALRKDGRLLGCIQIYRTEVRAFSEAEVTLVRSFADQAVIAMENARLLTETKEALEQQTATAGILQVISSSPTDTQPVFDAIAESAMRLLNGWSVLVWRYDGERMRVIASHGGLPGSDLASVHAALGEQRPDDLSYPGDAILKRSILQIADMEADDVAPSVREVAHARGWRANIAVPMLRDGTPIGIITVSRKEAGAFAEREIKLLQTFAAQTVIAIDNVRLFTELRDSLESLKAAQANLIQSEKMASLGQLTAGIAHEIKNPLNFVNNFAGLSVELLAEIREVAAPAFAQLDEDKRAEIDETMALITGNLEKIAEHGKRADGIVKSMLSHSRGGTGDWQAVDINALVEEALNLAFHGARAQDKNFNITLERDLVPASKPIEVVPQDVTRVFLNLIGNGFYAANKRRAAGIEPGFKPMLRVSTRDLGEMVEIKVRDNGTGIPDEVRAKLFQPFFTTKPTGEGTGLGLSISYDIVTQQHGGTIEVESEVGSFTEFTVRLPRSRRVAPAERTG
jgi:GAF domain-containing protein